MRAFLRASGRCILCVFIALFAHSVAVRAADFEVKVFRANGDSYREEDVEQVKREISLEWAQLQTRRAELDKETKRQTGEVSMPLAVLTGSLLSQAMQRVLVLRPKEARRLIGLVPQPPMNDLGRSIALYNISHWAETGRKLDDRSSNDWTVDVLYDKDMRGPSGARFVVDQIRYSMKFENGLFEIRRVTPRQ